uniref:Uncharacterized protein n=1 Tax=Cacopsylla melanoneura TaxID=428564 RepID=A0A8D8RM53_9HEMI
MFVIFTTVFKLLFRRFFQTIIISTRAILTVFFNKTVFTNVLDLFSFLWICTFHFFLFGWFYVTVTSVVFTIVFPPSFLGFDIFEHFFVFVFYFRFIFTTFCTNFMFTFFALNVFLGFLFNRFIITGFVFSDHV